jgi:hypothetical protein
MNGNCPRCGSTKIIPNQPIGVTVYTAGGPGGGTADVTILGAPHALFFTDPTHGGLTISVCGECGHAELHVHNHRKLYDKYLKTQQS